MAKTHKRGNRQPVGDWRNISDDREKYAAYLCSREWSEKREAVRKRSGGKCERCRLLPMDHVHHLTYARKYDEALEDLQASCKACHEFTHGKSDDDPVDAYIDTEETLYLAGKVDADDWRTHFVDPGGSSHDGWEDTEIHWRTMGRKCYCRYSGPYFTNCGHGQDHGPHSHGNNCLPGWPNPHDDPHIHRLVFDQCRAAIDRATLVLAWFSSADQYGTIFELGYACSKEKPILIGYDHSLRGLPVNDMWFPFFSAYERPICWPNSREFVESQLDEIASMAIKRLGVIDG